MPPPITRVQLRLGLDCILKMRYAREGLSQKESAAEAALQSAGRAMVAEHYWSCSPPDIDGRRMSGARVIGKAIRRAKSEGQPIRIRDVALRVDGILVRIGELTVRPDRWEVAEIFGKRMPADPEELRSGTGAIRVAWRPYLADLAVSRALTERWLAEHSASVESVARIQVSATMVGLRGDGREGPTCVIDEFRLSETGIDGAVQVDTRRGSREEGDRCFARVPLDRGETDRFFTRSPLVARTDGTEIVEGRPPPGDLGVGVPEAIDELRRVATTRQWPAPEQCISAHCKQCEFRVPGDPGSGFARCWGDDAVYRPDHILNMERLTDQQLQIAITRDGRRATVKSLARDDLRPIQKPHAEADGRTVRIDETLETWARERRALTADSTNMAETGPTHFLSLEVAQTPIPSWPGARPFEGTPFAFSAHRLPTEASALDQRVALPGFAQCEVADPRRMFVSALREQIGDRGPVYAWHIVAFTALRALRSSLTAEGARAGDAELVEFLSGLIGDQRGEGRLRDLMVIARGYAPPIAGLSLALRNFTRHVWKFQRISSAFQPGQGAQDDPRTYADPVDPARSLPPAPPLRRDLADSPATPTNDSERALTAPLLWLQCRTGMRQDIGAVQETLRAWGHLRSASILMAHHFLVNVAPVLAQQSADRNPRIFVSSTFRDFREERNLLKQQVEPQINKFAQNRMVRATVIDLRWGITDEQSSRGRTLPLCLQQVEHCRPFFVGLLGQRYGWVPAPKEFPGELVQRMPWLRKHVGGSSLTELEIRYGTLEAAIAKDDAYFYFRDAAYAAGKGPDFETTSPEEITKLESLKQAIRERGFHLREGYQDPRAFAKSVTDDLWAKIDALYPADLLGDAALEDWTAHRSYATQLIRSYQSDDTELQSVRACITDARIARVTIVGRSGTGKSALLAKSLEPYLFSNSAVVVQHFVGVGATPARVAEVARRIVAVSRSLLGVDSSAPGFDEPADAAQTLRALGAAARARGASLVIAIDGLEAAQGAEDFAWLRAAPHPGVKLILTALPSGVIAKTRAARSSCRRIKVGPLDAPRARAMVMALLEREAHSLPNAEINRILAHPSAGVPAFLNALLTELMVSADHEGLAARLRECLAARTLAGLHLIALRRIESELGEAFVDAALRQLASAPAGVTESELVAGVDKMHAELAALRLRLGNELVDAGGLISLPAGAFADAVRSRYRLRVAE